MPSDEQIKLQALADATARALIAIDADGTVSIVNKLAREQLGIEPGSHFANRHPDVWPHTRDILNGKLSSCEIPLQFSGHEYLASINPLLINDKVSGAICLLVASTQVDNMTRQLPSFQTLTRELDTIIDSSSDGLFVCDAKANVIRVNPASEKIHNLSAKELVGRNMRELIEANFIDRSAALEASQTKKQVSLLQNKSGRKLISIATPVFNDQGELIRVVVSERDITEIDNLQRELENQLAMKDGFRDQMLAMQQAEIESQQIIARSPAMLKALQQALKVANAESSVLILGESGVGKGLIADLIHKNSRRAAQPLIKINCGAIPESLIEAELFGYEKGAFTGALNSGKPGHFELADGGTLFLDEVAELPLPSQVKLLRFLEDGRITRLGATSSKEVNVRVLAATHQDLETMVQESRFRLDLYYRLNVIPIQVPAVRERRDCIIPLLRHYVEYFSAQIGEKKRLSRNALEVLSNYSFPGNVRELMNICERLVVMAETELIDLPDLPAKLHKQSGMLELAELDLPTGMSLQQAVEQVEKRLLESSLNRFRNQTEIAEALGVNQSTIARKLKKYGLIS